MRLQQSIFGRGRLYYHTLRFLRPKQILYKLLFFAKFSVYKRLCSLPVRIYAGRLPRAGGAPPICDFSPPQRDIFLLPVTGLPSGQRMQAVADQVAASVFDFLNYSVKFDRRVAWDSASVSHLWRYQLHYFQYARSLGVACLETGQERYYEVFRSLVEDWVRANPVGRLDGWHPYTISLRAVNWMFCYYLFRERLAQDEAFRSVLLRSLYKQVDFLSHHLEHEAGGNHLLANIKALIFAGCFFQGARAGQWAKTGRVLLARELDEQILGDGGHFERSPMYHGMVLQDLAEIYCLFKAAGMPVDRIQKRMLQMADFIENILSPAQQFPLFNDAAYGFAEAPDRLVRFVRECCSGSESKARGRGSDEGSVALKDTGYFIMRGRNGAYMAVDCGKVCPDSLPPHGHADTLSYELVLENQDFIVDSGTYEYAPGKWRDFFRSTRAHNTVEVDGQDQSETWGSFRIARRAFPGQVCWISGEEVDYFSGSHTGYTRLRRPVVHRRIILFIKNHLWYILDRLYGEGDHHAESFIHFHPDISLSRHEQAVVARAGTQRLTVVPFGHQEIRFYQGEEAPVQGWYSPEFGIKTANQVIGLQRTGPVPFVYGYLLVVGEVADWDARFEFQAAKEVYSVTLNGHRYRIVVEPDAQRLDMHTG